MLHAIHDVVLRFGIGDQHTNEPALQHSVKIACPRLVLQRRRGGRLPFGGVLGAVCAKSVDAVLKLTSTSTHKQPSSACLLASLRVFWFTISPLRIQNSLGAFSGFLFRANGLGAR